jgi:hypothetical protein
VLIGSMTHNTETERPFFVCKDVLDTVNSISWFFADAMWMLGSIETGLLLMIPTILTGLCLLYVEKRKPVILINVSINCWIWMNALWMLSDKSFPEYYLMLSKTFFILGIIFILLAAYFSQSIRETFSHFKRFRGLKL